MNDTLKNLLDEHKAEILEYFDEQPKKTVMDLKDGDKYFVINTNGDVCKCTWDDITFEKQRRSQGNLFLTCAEAEREAKRRELTFKLSQMDGVRDFVAGVRNWHICWGLRYYCFCVDGSMWIQTNQVYFDTKKQAKAALEQFTEEELKIICGVKS